MARRDVGLMALNTKMFVEDPSLGTKPLYSVPVLRFFVYELSDRRCSVGNR